MAEMMQIYALIGIVLIISIGFGLYAINEISSVKNAVNPDSIKDLGNRLTVLEQQLQKSSLAKPVAKMVYDSACRACGDVTGFAIRLSTQYNFEIQMYDIASTDAGQKQQASALVAAYNPEALPAMYIGQDEIVKSSFLQGIATNTIYSKPSSGGYLTNVFRAKGVDGSEILGKECGNSTNLKLQQFGDPYDLNTYNAEAEAKRVTLKYAGSFGINTTSAIDSNVFQYKIMLTNSARLFDKFGKDNVTLASKYFECAQEQGKVHEFKECFYDRWKKDQSQPLSQKDLSDCARNWGIYNDQLQNCIANADTKLNEDQALAASYGITATPYFVVNCKYITFTNAAEDAICGLGNVPGCGGSK